jgi:uncharacterized protein DUF3237
VAGSRLARVDLAYEFEYHVDLKKPALVGGVPKGPARVFFEVVGGAVKGERLNGTVLPGAGDWIMVGPDDWGRPDIRVMVQTGDGALIYVRYRGLLEMNKKVQDASGANAGTEFGDQYFRTAPVFETGHPSYAWLMYSLFVAEGRLTAGPGVDYKVYRVT